MSRPFAWVIPGDDNANMDGFLDAMCVEQGEFTKPLYADDVPALLARVAELEAVMARMAQGWDNAIELGLIPSQHVETAETLRDAARATSVSTTNGGTAA